MVVLQNKSLLKIRTIRIFIVFILIYSALISKIYTIQNSELSKMASMQSDTEILLGKTRGCIYDRNLLPLVNDTCNNFIAFISNNDNMPEAVKFSNKTNIKLKNGICYAVKNNNIINDDDGYVNYSLVDRYSEEGLCAHIIGYTDYDGYGVSGIEKAFDKILDDASGSLSLSFTVDGNGNAITGSGLKLINNNYGSYAGVVLTVDKNIQKITENALKNSEIISGAAVVLDVKSFEVIASASVPVYEQNDVSESLTAPNHPFVNKAVTAYPVGSVFKPFIAASALENGFNMTHTYFCNGTINVDANVFNCYNTTSHGIVDLNSAIENSCNCYFIDLGIGLGAKKITDTVSGFGFGNSIKFCSTITGDAGNFPSAAEITSDSQLANLCFGQGELLASPMQIAAAYCVLANGGLYKEPSVLKELVDKNKDVYGYYRNDDSKKVISDETCEIINICLYNNMLNGTGINGLPDNVSAAGKTATAQTGIFENGKERLCTWFAGFVPYENPKYVIVVFNENGSTASSDCAPVFKDIADKIYKSE